MAMAIEKPHAGEGGEHDTTTGLPNTKLAMWLFLLNRAVAVAMADGPDAGLALLDPLADELDRYHLFHAARADLLRRSGRTGEAKLEYRRALDLVTNPVERKYLMRRVMEA